VKRITLRRMACSWEKVALGRTGIRVTPLGLSSGPGMDEKEVERGIERGLDYLYWGSARWAGFGRAVRRAAAKRRSQLCLVVQSYTRVGMLMRPSLERALRQLGTEYADLLLLGLWNDVPPDRILDAALRLRESGKARHIMISCHHRPSFEKLARLPGVDVIMLRYNAAHPGAERDVFPLLPTPRPGVVAYNSTRWGQLLDRRLTPPGEVTPRGSDCYRFALTNPNVDVVASGPGNAAELDEALAALDRGPMSTDELAWMKRVGQAVHSSRPLTRLVAGRA
jgi:aryl-alcohol dehydrogenase-like predicted oxidoreductase